MNATTEFCILRKRREITTFVQFFCLTVPKNYIETIRCKRKLRVSKKILHRGISRFSIEKFLSQGTEKLRGRTLLCFKKFLESKNFMHERGEHQGLVENCLFHRTEKLHKRSLVCFRKFLVWKKIMDKRWGGGYLFFRRKFFVSQCPKTSWGPSMFRKTSGIEKFYA